MKNFLKITVWVLFVIPLVYLSLIWNELPQQLPMHYNLKGQVDRYGTKSEFLVLIAVVTLINIGVYFLLVNIHRIDPKRKYNEENLPRMRKLAFAITLFLSAIACFIMYSSLHEEMKFNSNFIVIGIGLLFTVIGNYFYSIKPNYFAGLRTPWALENEDNWRQTHQLGSKLWFTGGLAVIAAGLFLKDLALFLVMMIIILVLVIVPIIYSYRLYAKTKNQNK
jgi:uncharacterized membrane protein